MSDNMLYIFCEGHTELATLKHFLRPYWSQRFQDCEVRKYDGAPDLMMRFASDAQQEFRTGQNIFVLCLLDLYKEPFGVYQKNTMTHAEGFEAVQKQLIGQIGIDFQHRFGGFPVVMELETWLLADWKIQQQEINRSYSNPEEIEHPAEELKRWRSDYNKRIHGNNLFQKASAVRVYDDNCPRFKLLIDWLITEPEQPPSAFSLRFQEWEAQKAELQMRHSWAISKSERALAKGNLEEAVHQDEIRKKLEQDITNHVNNLHL